MARCNSFRFSVLSESGDAAALSAQEGFDGFG